jgi:ribose 5-phosphate isomerase A
MNQVEQNAEKKAAADAAAKLVETGMIVGLGTGSTAAFFIEALAARIARENLQIKGIPTSERSGELAKSLGIPLTSFAENVRLDLTVDGADEVEKGTLFLIKGHGGALLREKIVATSSARMVVIADETKVVERLGTHESVPVEVTQFGWQSTHMKLGKLGGTSSLRLGNAGKPYVTDGGNYIIDCNFGPMGNPKNFAEQLDSIVGVVEHGLFLGIASEVLIGKQNGTTVLKP